jgi:hypothetical protein
MGGFGVEFSAFGTDMKKAGGSWGDTGGCVKRMGKELREGETEDGEGGWGEGEGEVVAGEGGGRFAGGDGVWRVEGVYLGVFGGEGGDGDGGAEGAGAIWEVEGEV